MKYTDLLNKTDNTDLEAGGSTGGNVDLDVAPSLVSPSAPAPATNAPPAPRSWSWSWSGPGSGSVPESGSESGSELESGWESRPRSVPWSAPRPQKSISWSEPESGSESESESGSDSRSESLPAFNVASVVGIDIDKEDEMVKTISTNIYKKTDPMERDKYLLGICEETRGDTKNKLKTIYFKHQNDLREAIPGEPYATDNKPISKLDEDLAKSSHEVCNTYYKCFNRILDLRKGVNEYFGKRSSSSDFEENKESKRLKVENKLSAVDYVLDKQACEMPDIPDSDGGGD